MNKYIRFIIYIIGNILIGMGALSVLAWFLFLSAQDTLSGKQKGVLALILLIPAFFIVAGYLIIRKINKTKPIKPALKTETTTPDVKEQEQVEDREEIHVVCGTCGANTFMVSGEHSKCEYCGATLN